MSAWPADVVWVDDPNVYPNRSRISRKDVDPNALHGHKDVNLAWLKKHAMNVSYELRWWDGPSGHVGKWHTRTLSSPTLKLIDLRRQAAAIAATQTVWEVEVTMRARTHSYTGWDYGYVWSFGHAKRETTDAKRVRGEAP